MCQAKSQGGRRCTPHTAEAVTSATDAIHAAIARDTGTLAQRSAALDAALVRGRLARRAMADREAEIAGELGSLADAGLDAELTAREALAQKLLEEHPEWSRPGAKPAPGVRAAAEAERIAHERAMAVAPLVTPANLEALSAALADAGMVAAETAPHDRGMWLHRQTILAETAIAKRGKRSSQVGSTFVVRPPNGRGSVSLIRRPSGWALCDYAAEFDSRAPIPGLHRPPKFERPAPAEGPTPGFFEQLFAA